MASFGLAFTTSEVQLGGKNGANLTAMLFGLASQCSEIASPPHYSAENQLVISVAIEVHWKLEEDDTDISQTKSMLVDGPWTNSSTSVTDLYPDNLTSGYWQNTYST
ncbi:hypothetical protein Godav_023371, partial [Gossypium davidsonii]|nr:hypothetical protein [Gossypium davidsonii]